MFRDPRGTTAYDAMRPYVTRALKDEEIRNNVFRAWNAARKVYGELGGESPIGAASKLSSDKESVRENLDTTVKSLSEAIVRMSGDKRRKRGSWGPFLLLAGILVVLFNPATGTQTRSWLKDNLFGSEEEFDYSAPKY
ncbi:MAG: hypothetical protein JWO69_483 [Thermoleophilia bacterium]|jgi:hypothetical protein|nr:hypothetical protein [Thermoleophilia bacterium]